MTLTVRVAECHTPTTPIFTSLHRVQPYHFPDAVPLCHCLRFQVSSCKRPCTSLPAKQRCNQLPVQKQYKHRSNRSDLQLQLRYNSVKYIVAGTVCMPTSGVLSSMVAPATSGYATKIEALAVGWKLILISIPIAILFSIVVLVLIRLTASCFIHILIFLLIGLLVAFGIYVWFQPIGANAVTTSLFNSNFARIVTSIICFVLALAIFIFMCCYHSVIRLAAKIV